jgi:orotidine-5'-phosphate decarboxylase
MSTKDKIIVALDVDSCEKARYIVERLDGHANFFKIGLGLIGKGGLELALEMKKKGLYVFLDLKLFDISNTIENAVSGLCEAEFDFLTVQGDPQVVRAAVKGRGAYNMKILAVTFLTSLDRDDLDQNMIKPGTIEDLAVSRAEKAILAGADGVIASPKELLLLRKNPHCMKKIIVTPGIRPTEAATNDQKRVASPHEALKNGASYLVIGRPICQAKDPLAAYQEIQTEVSQS